MIKWSERDEDRLMAQWESEAELTWESATEIPESLMGEWK